MTPRRAKAARSSPGRAARWGAALAILAACAPPPAEHVREDNSFNVIIHGVGDGRPAPAAIDADDPRIDAARRELAGLLGHALGFDIDAATAAKFSAGLNEAYIRALEAAVTALDECRGSEPDAFAFGAPRLERVVVRYQPVRSAAYVPSHLEGGALSSAVYPDSFDLFDGKGLCSAFERELGADRLRRFTGVEPSDVAADDVAAYLDYLFESSGDGAIEELESIRRMAELEPRLADPERRERATRALAHDGLTLARAYRSQSDDARLLAALGRAQKAWIAWVNRRGTALEGSAQWSVIDALFLDERYRQTARELRRGFDSAAFASPIIEHFVANVATEDTKRTEDRAWMFVVCRARRGTRDDRLTVSELCNGAFYGDRAQTPEGRQALADLLLEERSEVLTQTAILHVLRTRGTERALDLLERLARDEEALHVALMALADYGGWRAPGTAEHPDPVHPRALIERVPRWWQRLPAQRPALLHVLFGTSGSGKEKLPWQKLPEFLGARIDSATLAAYLASDPAALRDLPRLMPSLSPGWPRAPVVVPALERWLDAHAAGRLGDANPSYAVENAFEALCGAGVARDFDALQRALRQRSERYPTQMRRLRSYHEGSRAQICPHEEAAPRAQPRLERVWFGD